MSKKHEKRTRAEILAKRAQPIEVIPARNAMTSLVAPKKAKPASKYMPHIGAKEQERAKRCYMSMYLNEQVAQFHPRDGHLRVSPTLCQIGRATHTAYLEAREQEYESVF